MYNHTTDGSSDNEAVKIANAFKPFWKKWMSEWGRNCVRSKKMTVTKAPSILSGLIGVTDAFSDTECMIPFQIDVANAEVGDTVWVRWMYDNQQTMYAECMGNISSQQRTVSGVIEPVLIVQDGYQSFDIIFDKPFDQPPTIVATLSTMQTLEYGNVSVLIASVSESGATIKIVNNASEGKRVGATWIATGVSSQTASLVVTQNANTGAITIY